MKSIELEGKTVEEALNKALIKLDVSENMVEVEVLSKGLRGLFNFIWSKPAKIKVTIKRNYTEDIKNFISTIIEYMDIQAKIDIKEENNVINVNLSGEKMGLIIGCRGETLDSLQCLISLMVNKNNNTSYKRVILDIENYRTKREETLRRVAVKTATKVKRAGKAFKLEPMNPYERRIIHSALQEDSFIDTYSEGKEPFRRVVVELKINQ